MIQYALDAASWVSVIRHESLIERRKVALSIWQLVSRNQESTKALMLRQSLIVKGECEPNSGY